MTIICVSFDVFTDIEFFSIGQNKNNYFSWYLLYRTIADLHKSVEYTFMTVGHTKFSCDRNFGVLKKKTNVTDLGTLYKIAETVNNSGTLLTLTKLNKKPSNLKT